MLGRVLQRLLGGPVHRRLGVLGHAQRGRIDPDVEGGERVAQALQAGGQAEVVQHRGTQPGDRGPGLVQRGRGQLLGPGHLLRGDPRRTRDGVGRGRQVEEQADDALADPIVDLPGHAAPFMFLPFDHPLGEPFQRLLPLGQPTVQPGVLDRAGHQARHRAEQFDIRLGELAAQPGVHVQHADQMPHGGDHRHRQHGGELLAAQRRDVAVPGVGRLVVHDDGGLAVVGHPAGHPLAQRQLDGADHGVEGGRRPAQLELAAPLVEQVHEAHVGLGGLRDQLGHALQDAVQVQAGRDGLDHLGQELRLPLRVGDPQSAAAVSLAHARGQWKTPSRSATATAPARSDTPSLR